MIHVKSCLHALLALGLIMPGHGHAREGLSENAAPITFEIFEYPKWVPTPIVKLVIGHGKPSFESQIAHHFSVSSYIYTMFNRHLSIF